MSCDRQTSHGEVVAQDDHPLPQRAFPDLTKTENVSSALSGLHEKLVAPDEVVAGAKVDDLVRIVRVRNGAREAPNFSKRPWIEQLIDPLLMSGQSGPRSAPSLHTVDHRHV